MSINEWIMWGSIETSKYMLVIYGVLGFSKERSKRRYMALFYLLIGIPLVTYCSWDVLVYTTLWVFVLAVIYFEGTIRDKLRAAVVSYFAVTFADTTIWSIYINLMKLESHFDAIHVRLICNLTGLILWLILSGFLHHKKEKIHTVFTDMSVKMFLAMMLFLLGTAAMVGVVQFSILDNITEDLRKTAMLCEMFSALVTILGWSALTYMVYMKKKLENECQIDALLYEKQQGNYEQMLQKYENLRSFRHDLKKHLKTINAFCEQKQVDKIQEYIQEILEDHQKNTVVKTGNAIADCFLNSLFDAMQEDKQFHYNIVGQFSPDLCIDNKDMCILIGNLAENAEHAMKKITGEKVFNLEIKQYSQMLFMSISNTAAETAIDEIRQRKKGHYGIHNIENVVRKYQGDIRYLYNDGMLCIKISMECPDQ